MTEGEYREADDDHEGRCVASGAVATLVEPDARGYACEVCGAKSVFGLEELVLMGVLDITRNTEGNP